MRHADDAAVYATRHYALMRIYNMAYEYFFRHAAIIFFADYATAASASCHADADATPRLLHVDTMPFFRHFRRHAMLTLIRLP